MPLLNVRLGPEEQRLAEELRAEGIPVSKLVRQAIRDEHARRIGGRKSRRKPSELVASLFEEFPDARGAKGHGIDTTDPRAVRAFIAKRLRVRR
jgi:hypothetical protein